MTLLEKNHRDWLKLVWLENSGIFQFHITRYFANRVSLGINGQLRRAGNLCGLGISDLTDAGGDKGHVLGHPLGKQLPYQVSDAVLFHGCSWELHPECLLQLF